MRRYHARILAQLQAMQRLANDTELRQARDPAVSGWGIGEHLEHLTRVDLQILTAMDRIESRHREDESQAGTLRVGKPNMTGRLVLLLGRLPRGRAKSAEAYLPQGWSGQELLLRLREVQARVEAKGPLLGDLEAFRATAKHPILGHLDLRSWMKFIGLHHDHHLRIVTSIQRHMP